jgi:phenylalanyl-tRNA synthetase alpha subunit
VKKRGGKWEEYVESNVEAGVKASGATAKEAAQVAKEVTAKFAKKTEITANELSEAVVKVIEKVNKAAAKEFVRLRNSKLKAKKRNSSTVNAFDLGAPGEAVPKQVLKVDSVDSHCAVAF